MDGAEDEPIVLLPGDVFGNDVDPEGDVIFFESAEVRRSTDRRLFRPQSAGSGISEHEFSC